MLVILMTDALCFKAADFSFRSLAPFSSKDKKAKVVKKIEDRLTYRRLRKTAGAKGYVGAYIE